MTLFLAPYIPLSSLPPPLSSLRRQGSRKQPQALDPCLRRDDKLEGRDDRKVTCSDRKGSAGISPSATTLNRCAARFASSATSALSGSPLAQPSTPIAKELYKIFTQFEKLGLDGTVQIPITMTSDNQEAVVILKIKIGDKGRLEYARLTFDPTLGPFPIVPYLHEVPLIGYWLRIGIEQARMDSRRHTFIEAPYPYNERRYPNLEGESPFEFEIDIRKVLTDRSGFAQDFIETLELDKPMPEYVWQVAELIENAIQKKKDSGDNITSNRVSKIKIDYARASVDLDVNFDNQEFTYGPLQLIFSAPSQEPRLSIHGPLFDSAITLRGLHRAEFDHPEAIFKINNEGTTGDLIVHVKKGNGGLIRPSFEIESYETEKFSLEVIPKDSNKSPAKIELREGFRLQGLSVDTDQAHLHADRLVAKHVLLQGFGINFQTSSGDYVQLENLNLSLQNGIPRMSATVNGRVQGEVVYSRDAMEMGRASFRQLSGAGQVQLGPDDQGHRVLEIKGHLDGDLNQSHWKIVPKKLSGFFDVDFKDLNLSGHINLHFDLDTREIILEPLDAEHLIALKGQGGSLYFHQDAVQVWPALAPHDPRDAKHFVSDLKFDLGAYLASVRRLVINLSESKILEGDLGPLQVAGDLDGALFICLKGVCNPFTFEHLATSLQFTKAQNEIGEDGGSLLRVLGIEIRGEEKDATFSDRDKKRCKADRQRIFLGLETLLINLEDFDLLPEGFSNSSFILHKLIGGGCVSF